MYISFFGNYYRILMIQWPHLVTVGSAFGNNWHIYMFKPQYYKKNWWNGAWYINDKHKTMENWKKKCRKYQNVAEFSWNLKINSKELWRNLIKIEEMWRNFY